MAIRKTKIICTLGPATDDREVLKKLMLAGMDVARLNFSHGVYEDHKKRIDMVKELRRELGRPVGIMLDTRGPEIRIGLFKNGSVLLKEGDAFTLTTREVEGDETIVSVTYQSLPKELSKGNRVLLNDGLIELSVASIEDTDIHCTVVAGGKLSNRKSINLPDLNINMPYMNDRDRDDILFGIEQDVDFVAASFVRCAFDVLEVKKILEHHGAGDVHVIAKIENNAGVLNIDEILSVADGIMVARGDMGVEIPLEELPRIQKMLIRKCYLAGKKAITATQMLESMITNVRPTRAEVTDIANAIFDGTSAIMLSGETAAGEHPVESVATMARIALAAEGTATPSRKILNAETAETNTITNAISHATCTTAHDLGAAAIITVTCSGYTARMISKFRPECNIIAATTNERVFRQLTLSWGVTPVMNEMKQTTDELFDAAVEKAITTGLVENGDLVVITGGTPVGISGSTNIVKVQLVGDVLLEGTGVNNLNVSGEIFVAKTEDDAIVHFREGEILVIPRTTNELLPILKKAKGIICEEPGAASHAAIVGMTLDIPVLTGAKNATDILKCGTVVTIDSAQGLVYSGTAKYLQ